MLDLLRCYEGSVRGYNVEGLGLYKCRKGIGNGNSYVSMGLGQDLSFRD